MYRILVVDDEPVIANAMHSVLQNNKDMNLDVYKAYSGHEAMNFLIFNKVDIVITDIRMPGMDGLELLKNIRLNWPQCRVIILTGHKEFEYLYKATQYKGVSYILKTEGYNKIIKTVKNVTKEIEDSLKMENILELANKQIALAIPILQKEFLTNMIKGKIDSISDDQFNELEISLKFEKEVLMLIGRFDNLNISIEYKKKTECFYSILLMAKEYFEPVLSQIGIIDGNNNIVWFIQPKQFNASKVFSQKCVSEWEKATIFLKGMLEMIQASSRNTLNLNISFSLSNAPVKWNDVQIEYDFLNQLLNFKTGTSSEMILTESDYSFNSPEQKVSKEDRQIKLCLTKINVLKGRLEKGEKREYFESLEQIMGVFNVDYSLNYYPLLELYYSLSIMFLSFLNKWNLTEKIAFSIGVSKIIHIEEYSSWNEAIMYIKKLSEIIFEIQSEEKKDKTRDVISKVNNFIAENISEELSLIKIGEYVHFNPSYLSRLYKQETGLNISEHIINYKILVSKNLLKKSDLKIYEVAKSVGYDVANNFTRFFKNEVGLTPEQYKCSLQEAEPR